MEGKVEEMAREKRETGMRKRRIWMKNNRRGRRRAWK